MMKTTEDLDAENTCPCECRQGVEVITGRGHTVIYEVSLMRNQNLVLWRKNAIEGRENPCD